MGKLMVQLRTKTWWTARTTRKSYPSAFAGRRPWQKIGLNEKVDGDILMFSVRWLNGKTIPRQKVSRWQPKPFGLSLTTVADPCQLPQQAIGTALQEPKCFFRKPPWQFFPSWQAAPWRFQHVVSKSQSDAISITPRVRTRGSDAWAPAKRWRRGAAKLTHVPLAGYFPLVPIVSPLEQLIWLLTATRSNQAPLPFPSKSTPPGNQILRFLFPQCCPSRWTRRLKEIKPISLLVTSYPGVISNPFFHRQPTGNWKNQSSIFLPAKAYLSQR